MSIPCILVWALALIALPLIIIWNLSESKGVKIRRARANNQTWKQIAARYGVSQSTVRRWSIA